MSHCPYGVAAYDVYPKPKLGVHSKIVLREGSEMKENGRMGRDQWLKCNGTQENAVPPPPIYDSKRSPTSDCYNARKRHTTIVRRPNLNVAFPHL